MRLVDIEPFENHLQEICDNLSNSPQHALMKIITMGYLKKLKSLSTAETEQWWIPVAERLPEPNTRCLVTTEDGYVDIDDYYIYGWDDNGDTVIAWRPMPDPYQEDKQCD